MSLPNELVDLDFFNISSTLSFVIWGNIILFSHRGINILSKSKGLIFILLIKASLSLLILLMKYLLAALHIFLNEVVIFPSIFNYIGILIKTYYQVWEVFLELLA